MVNLVDIIHDPSLRFDTKAVQLFSKFNLLQGETVPLRMIADVQEIPKCSKPEEPFAYHEISSVDEFGMGEPFWIDEANIERGSEEERILTKVEKGDIALPQPGSILVPKVRPYLGKFVLVKNANVYYTSAFFQVRPRKISSQLLYCVLKHPVILDQMFRLSRVGKGYPTITAFDLGNFVRLPAILLTVNEEADRKVSQELDALLATVGTLQGERDIIDGIYKELFPSSFTICDGKRSFIRSISDMGKSFDLRMSAHLLSPGLLLVEKILQQLTTVKLVRLCKLPISLGTSPSLCEEETGYYYLGPRAMAGEQLTTEKLEPVPEEFYLAKKDRFNVQYGDVFLRRSGASLGKVLYYDYDAELPCIYSDFMMRLRFRDYLLGEYVAYWMRTSLFQTFLRRVAVIGKGLQNIYPYQVEMMPVPDPAEYNFKEVVFAIRKQINERKRTLISIKEKIELLQEHLWTEFGFTILRF